MNSVHELRIYYYRARYYDPQVGRFVSEDPLEFAGDGPDFYAYTLNNPVTYTDPMGTSVFCPSFLSWCIPNPPNPPAPGQPGTPGGPPLGGFIYNAPPPTTGPLSGEALALANCMARCLARYFVVSGGSECTPDGRHVQNGAPNSKHCTNQAFDMHSAGQDRNKAFCCALGCGAKYIKDEGDRWHFQTVPGLGKSPGLLPKPCDCK